MAQATRDAAVTVAGRLLFAYNVSAHMMGRALEAVGTPPLTATAYELSLANEELATSNEELATSEELLVSNEELATTNAQLSIANAQLHAANFDIQAQELRRAHKVLRHLNQQLDGRVAERTAQLQDALRHTEEERTGYAEALDQTPALVCLLRGPAHRFELMNHNYQRLYSNRLLAGRTLAEAFPEVDAQGFGALLDRVYATGETYREREVPFADAGSHGPREWFFDFTYQAARVHGEIVGVDVCAFDVTDQVQVRQQVAVAILRGPRYVIELANPAMCVFWGRPAVQVLGQSLFDALLELVG